jgi:hypothetical protein
MDAHATEEAFSLQKKTSSTSKHEIFKNFLFLWVIFVILDLDPDSESRSGSTDLIEYGSETLLNSTDTSDSRTVSLSIVYGM